MKIRKIQQSARPGNSEQIRASNLDVVHEDTASTEVKELEQPPPDASHGVDHA
jgi:hypothetical protein